MREEQPGGNLWREIWRKEERVVGACSVRGEEGKVMSCAVWAGGEGKQLPPD